MKAIGFLPNATIDERVVQLKKSVILKARRLKNETQAESETEATGTQETGKKPRKNSKRTKDKEMD